MKTGATGLEPATSGVTGRRSNQLSYAPVWRPWSVATTPRRRAGRIGPPFARERPPPLSSGGGPPPPPAALGGGPPPRTASGGEPSPALRKSPAHCATNRLVPRRTRQLVVNAPVAAVRTVWCCQRVEPGASMLTVTRSLPRAAASRPVTVIVDGRWIARRGLSVTVLARPASPPVREESSPDSPPRR